jgi:hypothetical protein
MGTMDLIVSSAFTSWPILFYKYEKCLKTSFSDDGNHWLLCATKYPSHPYQEPVVWLSEKLNSINRRSIVVHIIKAASLAEAKSPLERVNTNREK